ncbi:MAG: FAD-binding oxidoreductase [Actinomycetota bacterium]
MPETSAQHDALIADLIDVVGAAHVLTDDARAGFEIDWTGRYGGTSTAVARPGSTGEVAAVLPLCARHGASVVTQGGNTGLVGGSVPRPTATPTVVLSTQRLDSIGEADPDALQVTVGAGATLAAVRDRVGALDLDIPVDFAARDSATIGGAVATNAGGSRVVRFGTMRHHVAGVRAVLADGSVVGSLAGLPKETAGLHWPSLLAGSEGTLGVITEVRLRLVPTFAHAATALVAVDGLSGAARLAGRLRREVSSIDQLELIEPEAMDLVAGHLGRSVPWAVPAGGSYVLIECADRHDPLDDLTRALAAPATADVIDDAIVTTDAAQRRQLIEHRDRMTEAIASAATASGTPVFKLDVAVPLHRLAELVRIARSAAATDGARLIPFGHVAEGNVHLNYLDASDTERIAETVLTAVAEAGGTVSAEHGIGIAKARWLPLIRSAAERRASAAVRTALDPNRLLNPGVLEASPVQVP